MTHTWVVGVGRVNKGGHVTHTWVVAIGRVIERVDVAHMLGCLCRKG